MVIYERLGVMEAMKYRFQLKYKKQMLFEDEKLGFVKVQEANIVKVDNLVLGEILRLRVQSK